MTVMATSSDKGVNKKSSANKIKPDSRNDHITCANKAEVMWSFCLCVTVWAVLLQK